MTETLETWMTGAPKEDKTFGNWIDKILAKSYVDDRGCLNYTGHIHGSGYGRCTYKGKSKFIHRMTWEFLKGPIPKGSYICHKCDNPRCFNIEHLFLGSPNDNIQDMVSKGRHYRLHDTLKMCRRGHEMTEENTYIRRSGYKNCRKCIKIIKEINKI